MGCKVYKMHKEKPVADVSYNPFLVQSYKSRNMGWKVEISSWQYGLQPL